MAGEASVTVSVQAGACVRVRGRDTLRSGEHEAGKANNTRHLQPAWWCQEADPRPTWQPCLCHR